MSTALWRENKLAPEIAEAIREVWIQDGVLIKPKGKNLLKFGKIESLGTSFETIWQQGGNETYATSNVINKISSSDNGDTQAVKYEYHTIDGSGNFTFGVGSVTLQGHTETDLPVAAARASRIYNDTNTDFAGNVYVYEDDTVVNGVPQTASKIHLKTGGAGYNQSLKAATTISNTDYWLITDWFGSVLKKTSAVVDFEIQIALKGKVFRTRIPGSGSTTGSVVNPKINPPLIVPSNSDFRIRAQASTTGVAAIAWANGILCKVVG